MSFFSFRILSPTPSFGVIGITRGGAAGESLKLVSDVFGFGHRPPFSGSDLESVIVAIANEGASTPLLAGLTSNYPGIFEQSKRALKRMVKDSKSIHPHIFPPSVARDPRS